MLTLTKHPEADALQHIAEREVAKMETCEYCDCGSGKSSPAVAVVNLRSSGQITRVACCERHRDILREDSHYNGEIHIDDA